MYFTKQLTVFMGFMLFLCLTLTISFSSGDDTISGSLSGDETIISKGEIFELGFFKAGNSSNYYIGIWYKKYSSNPPTIVWVANRETPVSDRFSSALKIIENNLVLLNESKLPIWSTNVTSSNSSSSRSAIAVILDDGNLVLRNGLDSVEPVCQSFDHPAHTWLSGARFSYDKRTNKSQVLTSWKSRDDPAVGLYSFELVPSQKMFVNKWNGSQRYWDTGSWDPLMINSFYNFSYETNENESYFTYAAYNPSVVSRFLMDVSGQLQQQTWVESTKQWNVFWAQPETQCKVYAFCGAFGTCKQAGLLFCNCLTGFEPRSETEWNQGDFSGGCVRKTDLICGRNMEKPDFLMIKVTNMPPNSSVAVKSAGECRTACSNSCSCNAYSFVGKNCSVWDGELLNLSEDNANGKTIHVKVSSKDLPSHKTNKRVAMVTIVACLGGVVLVLGLLVLITYIKRRLVRRTTMDGSLMAFVYKDLQIATKNFSDKLGGGGFGSVFKGVLCDSSIVAVKKLKSISQGDKQFRSEVSTIGMIQHVNLVRLRGFCAQGVNKLLVYDYMPNGSLDSHLFHEKEDGPLSWNIRYQIALGIARGLVYLHEKCRDCIIHCDIKPENILLDADFHPKIADFGLAKLMGRDFSRVLTTIRGTRGYLAPEWLSGVAVTAKADVFSYGMMLFELVHGKRNVEQSENSSFTFFPSLAANVVMARGDILSVLDRRLNREASVEQVTTVCKIAYWCIQDDVDSRPSMSQVEQILEGVLDVKMPPIPQSVQFFVDQTEHLVFVERSSTRSSQVKNNSSSGDSKPKNASS